jgi:hypothetical protein
MKAELVKNTEKYGGGVFSSGRKRALEPKKPSEHPQCQRKTEGGQEKRLANLWRRNRIKKNGRAGRGQQIIWEIPGKYESVYCPPLENSLA